MVTSRRLPASIIILIAFHCSALGFQNAIGLQLSEASSSNTDQRKITPSFPYKDGWIGADAAYSVPFASNQSLWLFGDSFIGNSNARSRAGAALVRNSVGVANYDQESGWNIKYFWKGKGKSDPKSFFEPKSGAGFWYWPMDGFLAGQKLYVALSKVRNLNGQGPFNFEVTGVDLARISNYDLSPEKWGIEYLELHDGNESFPGVSISVIGQYVFLYTLRDLKAEKRRPVLLERIAVKHLGQPSANLEYYARDHKWKRGFDVNDAAEVFPEGATEMSVRYHEDTRKWTAISGPAFMSNRIMFSTAEALTGPWSAWRSIYEIPEMKAGSSDFDKENFCYAGKEHSEFYEPDVKSMLVTYVCNSTNVEKLMSNKSIYRPISLYLQLPVAEK